MEILTKVGKSKSLLLRTSRTELRFTFNLRITKKSCCIYNWGSLEEGKLFFDVKLSNLCRFITFSFRSISLEDFQSLKMLSKS